MCDGGCNLLRFTLSEFFKTLCRSSLSLKQSDFRVIARHNYIFGVLDFWWRCYIRGSYTAILLKFVRIRSILFSKYLCLIDTSLPLLPFFSPSSTGHQHMWIVLVKSMLVTSLQYVMQGKRMLSGIKTNLIISYSFSLPVSAIIYTICPTVTHIQICILDSFSHLCCS